MGITLLNFFGSFINLVLGFIGPNEAFRPFNLLIAGLCFGVAVSRVAAAMDRVEAQR